MKKLCNILDLNEKDLFDKITSSFKEKITNWDYFVNWKKVFKNISTIEKELNILNYLIGKEDIEKETYEIIKEYPKVVKAFPYLIAIRDKSVEILIDTRNFIYSKYNFDIKKPTEKECKELAYFFVNSGMGDILKKEKVKNLVDYVTGVEVGLDSNARKNRVGQLMETYIEVLVFECCSELNLEYIPQATAIKIKEKWGIELKESKSKKTLDFAINNNGKLVFIECNFYGGGGSKLKATATEYIEMSRYWNEQNIDFIWVTDGAGWKTALYPLKDYFNATDYLLNLEMLKEGVLIKILG